MRLIAAGGSRDVTAGALSGSGGAGRGSQRRSREVGRALDGKRREPSRPERFYAFRRRFGDAFPRPLPEAIGHCQFLYFDADWTPRLLGERGTAPPVGEGERARALRGLTREFKITWGPRWMRVSVYVVALLAVAWPLEALASSLG